MTMKLSPKTEKVLDQINGKTRRGNLLTFKRTK